MTTARIIAEYLETYEGRDKFLRTLSYAAKLATMFPKSDGTILKLKRFGSEMSKCRVVLRLLDDIPSLYNAIDYGWGKQEPDIVIRCLELTELFVDVIYSPIESICWAGEMKLIPIDVDKWDNASTYFWILSLTLSLLKASRRYEQLSKQKQMCLRSSITKNTDVKAVNNRMYTEMLICTRMILDLSYAISYLPSGKLWGGKLSTWHVGALGTISSLIGLYQALSRKSQRLKMKTYLKQAINCE